MIVRKLIIGLLFVALFLPFFSLPTASSQSTGTTTSMTMSQPPSQGQCTMLTLAFTAHTGEQIIGTYGSDVSINFYILSQNDLSAFQNCRLNPSVRPIFIEEKSVGHNNPYRSLTFPADGTYYFVFLFVKGPTQLTKGYATVELSYPSSVVIMGTTGSVSAPMTSTIISLTSTSAVTSPSTTSTTAALSATSTPPTSSIATSTSTSIPVASTTTAATEQPPASSFSIFGFEMPLTTLLLIIGGVVVAAGGIIGGSLFRNRKRRLLSSYLAKIDSTYNEFAVDREDCRTRLEQLKNDVIEKLNKGQIDEGHFLMLDEKISEYQKELNQATPKYKRTSGSDDSSGTQPAGSPSDSAQTTGQIRYCSNCGAKLSSEEKVCKRCGTTQ